MFLRLPGSLPLWRRICSTLLSCGPFGTSALRRPPHVGISYNWQCLPPKVLLCSILLPHLNLCDVVQKKNAVDGNTLNSLLQWRMSGTWHKRMVLALGIASGNLLGTSQLKRNEVYTMNTIKKPFFSLNKYFNTLQHLSLFQTKIFAFSACYMNIIEW